MHHDGPTPLASDMGVETGAGSVTLEVRWIHRGELPGSMLEWLGRFHEEIEERTDRYLVEPSAPELGVKIKGGRQLDLKAHRGSPGELALPGRIRGRLELWEKWSFPLTADGAPPVEGTAWCTLEKVRHRRSFRVLAADVEERSIDEAELPGCTLELTEVRVDGEPWWTLALEAGGSRTTLDHAVRTTGATVFGTPPPDGVRLTVAESMSYARWLGLRLRASR